MLKRILSGIAALLVSSAIAWAVIDGINSASQSQQVSVGQLQIGMGSATGNSVTISNGAGVITTAALTTAAGATQAITLTNTRIAAGDLVFAIVDPNGSAGQPIVANVAVSAGSASIVIQNIHASAALNAAIKIYFVIVKAGNSN